MSRPRPRFRVTAVWPWAPDSTYEKTDRAQVCALARRWAAAGATATVEQDVGGWQWRHVKTYEPPAVKVPAPVVEVPPPAVEDDVDDSDLYERLMRQAPNGRDHRGRVACRHVVGGRGIR
ncbi:hypothetical protein [Streptomyces sp. RKAG293]|uniref:hypothetical protein n=1 Tax=Streptomyces sp. RKAG293 TaxID=2893403 RepID=UPI0020342E23|nr:hypothetical protein [Streptomyces sp. RKAG293]MCM2420287.1 hypothetical protein [Streptomyces sp. RKAG293]